MHIFDYVRFTAGKKLNPLNCKIPDNSILSLGIITLAIGKKFRYRQPLTDKKSHEHNSIHGNVYSVGSSM